MAVFRYDLQIQSRLSLVRADDFLSIIRLQSEMLPEYMPEKWGWAEPYKNYFDPLQPEQLLENNAPVNVWWKRGGKHKAAGCWLKRWESSVEHLGDTHSSIRLSVFETLLQDKLLAYMKVAGRRFLSDIALFDSIPAGYVDFALASDLGTWSRRGDPNTAYVSLTTHTLRHWLPDMPWAVVLGPAYVRMFGKRRILDTPAYKVEDLGQEQVYLQLTPRVEDIHERYDFVMAARNAAKLHLGEDAFFHTELAYDYKNPANKEKAGKVFRVPEFELLDEI